MSESIIPEVTVIMGPRERYSAIPRTLESFFECTTDIAYKLVVVDGGLPEHRRAYLEKESKARGFTFIHEDYLLSPNEAKNIGIDHSDTEFVVFVDNDALFTPGWLKPLVDAAKETGAWLVGPTIVDGDFETGIVHVAGGDTGFREVDGVKSYFFDAYEWHKPFAEVRGKLKREKATMLEIHVLLARRDIFDKIGKFDEEILAFGDFHDICHEVNKAGGTIIYEPASIVSFYDPGTDLYVLEKEDLPMYWLRWSEDWAERSLRRCAEKWNLDPNDPWLKHSSIWMEVRRRESYKLHGPFGKLVGVAVYKIPVVGKMLENLLISQVTGKLVSQREGARPRMAQNASTTATATN